MGRRALAMGLCTFGLLGVATPIRRASACGGGSATPLTALPASGATEVSSQTPVFVVTPGPTAPGGLELVANDVVVARPALTLLGSGFDRGGGSGGCSVAGPGPAAETRAMLFLVLAVGVARRGRRRGVVNAEFRVAGDATEPPTGVRPPI